MKNKYWLLIAVVVLTAQTAFAAKNDGGVSKSSATVAVEQEISTITAKDVTNYKTFLEYANKTERLAVKAGKPAEIQPGEIIKVNRSGANFQLSAEKPVVYDEQTKALASLDANKHVAILEANSNVNILDSKGRVLKQTKIVPYHTGPGYIVFSDSRIFQYAGIFDRSGIRIYDYDGKLLKEIDPGYIFAKAISHSQKYLAVIAYNTEYGVYFILYDMNGNEQWRAQIVNTTNAIIYFSRDDKFAVVKMPYYRDHGWGGAIKERKLYLIDIENHKISSDENY